MFKNYEEFLKTPYKKLVELSKSSNMTDEEELQFYKFNSKAIEELDKLDSKNIISEEKDTDTLWEILEYDK